MNWIKRWWRRRKSSSGLGAFDSEPMWPVGYPPMPPAGFTSWCGVPEELRGPVKEWSKNHDEWMRQNGWIV